MNEINLELTLGHDIGEGPSEREIDRLRVL